MSKQRITIETLASGQPRPYANTILCVRVTFEHDWDGKGWRASSLDRNLAIARLQVLGCGFPDKEPENWASTQLDWLRCTAPGVWEFHTTTPFTD
jgi:hypothetical protein